MSVRIPIVRGNKRVSLASSPGVVNRQSTVDRCKEICDLNNKLIENNPGLSSMMKQISTIMDQQSCRDVLVNNHNIVIATRYYRITYIAAVACSIGLMIGSRKLFNYEL